MGMYDRLVFSPDPGKVSVLCAAGHVQTDFQTKDFDCGMDDYCVHRGALYVKNRGFVDDGEQYEFDLNRDDELTIVRKMIAIEKKYEGGVLVYTSCEVCLPVLYVGAAGRNWVSGHVDERRPWVEGTLIFEHGQLKDVAYVRRETREDIRRELEERGLLVLKDDEAVARAHFARFQAKKGRG